MKDRQSHMEKWSICVQNCIIILKGWDEFESRPGPCLSWKFFCISCNLMVVRGPGEWPTGWHVPVNLRHRHRHIKGRVLWVSKHVTWLVLVHLQPQPMGDQHLLDSWGSSQFRCLWISSHLFGRVALLISLSLPSSSWVARIIFVKISFYKRPWIFGFFDTLCFHPILFFLRLMS